MLGFITSLMEKVGKQEHAFLQQLALEKFVEHHHREPTPQELKQLEVEWLQRIETFLVDKYNDFLKASDLLIEKLPKAVPADQWQEIKKEFSLAFNKLNTLPTSSLPEGNKNALHALLGITMKTLRACYETGKGFFRDDKHPEASTIFSFLTYLNPYVADFWVALGLCYHKAQKYTEALEAFAKNCALDSSPFLARAKSAEIYIEQKQLNEAKREVEHLERLVASKKAEEQNWSQIAEGLAYKIDVVAQYGA